MFIRVKKPSVNQMVKYFRLFKIILPKQQFLLLWISR